MRFKAVSADELRKPRKIYASDKEWLEVNNSAGARHMTTSNFVMAAALGRKTEVTFEANITVQLGRCVSEIRGFVGHCQERNIVLPNSLEKKMSATLRKIETYLSRHEQNL